MGVQVQDTAAQFPGSIMQLRVVVTVALVATSLPLQSFHNSIFAPRAQNLNPMLARVWRGSVGCGVRVPSVTCGFLMCACCLLLEHADLRPHPISPSCFLPRCLDQDVLPPPQQCTPPMPAAAMQADIRKFCLLPFTVYPSVNAVNHWSMQPASDNAVNPLVNAVSQ